MGHECVLSVQVRNEAGQMVLAGPKKGEEGSMYKKWAKHNKASIMATGAQPVQPGGGGRLLAHPGVMSVCTSRVHRWCWRGKGLMVGQGAMTTSRWEQLVPGYRVAGDSSSTQMMTLQSLFTC
jgi:hypothetical protein